MKRAHRSVHPWLWMLTGAASVAVLIIAVWTKTDPTPDQPAVGAAVGTAVGTAEASAARP